ncbi:MAG: hypothetical protein ACHQRJ_14450 [Alphaproteobacteria bacterium]
MASKRCHKPLVAGGSHRGVASGLSGGDGDDAAKARRKRLLVV